MTENQSPVVPNCDREQHDVPGTFANTGSANLRALPDPDHFSVGHHSDAAGRATIVWYWAAAYGSSPSDSWRMFWRT